MSAIIHEYIRSVHGATNVAVGRVSSGGIHITLVGCHNLSRYCHCCVRELTLLEERSQLHPLVRKDGELLEHTA